MNYKSFVVVDPRGVAIAFGLAVLAAVFVAVSGFNSPAFATKTGGDGGTGGGSGSCSYAGVWQHGKGLGAISNSGNGTCYNTGNMQADLNRVGANGCWANRGELVDVWFFTVGGQWATYPSDASMTRAAVARDAIANKGNASTASKQEAYKHVKSTNNVIICTWQSQLTTKVTATKPTTTKGTCTHRPGWVNIPTQAQSANQTTYFDNNGNRLTKGSRIAISGDTYVVEQRVDNNRFVFGDGSSRKRWTLNPQNMLASNCQISTDPVEFEDTTMAACDGQYATGGGWYSIPRSNKVRYYVGGYHREPGTYYGGSGVSVTVTAVAIYPHVIAPGETTVWSHRFETAESLVSCDESDLTYEFEDRDVITTSCTDTTETHQVTGPPETLGTLPYQWSTELSDGMTAGRNAGSASVKHRIAPQTVSKPTPLATLFSTNPSPTRAQINAAIAAGNTAARASTNLSAANVTSLSRGTLMNVVERTAQVPVIMNRDTVMRTPVRTCVDWHQPQSRTTAVVTTTSKVPFKYMVLQYNTVNHPRVYRYTWDVITRNANGSINIREGQVCTAGNVPAGAHWSTRTSTACGAKGNASIFNWGWSWNVTSSGQSDSACATTPNTNTQRVRNCREHTPSHSRTEVTGSTNLGTLNACPSRLDVMCWPIDQGTTTTVQTGSTPWANDGPAYRGDSRVTRGTPVAVGTVDAGAGLGAQTPQVTGFWQVLSNSCNVPELLTVRDGSATAVLGSGTHMARAMVSPKLNAVPAQPLWGPNSKYPRTNETGFYDKHCTFEGEVAASTTQGQESVIFRNNEPTSVEVPLYRPRAVAGVVAPTTGPALATVVTRWKDGTPNVNGWNVKGAFRAFAGSTSMFAPTDSTPAAMRSWQSYSAASGLTWAVVPGQHHKFTMAGTWASDKGKPNVFSTKWIYEADVTQVIPSTNIGFNAANGARTYGTATVPARVHGQVIGAVRNTGAYPTAAEVTAHRELARTNSGTGATNVMDRTLRGAPAGGSWGSTNPLSNPYYRVVRFVRGVAN